MGDGNTSKHVMIVEDEANVRALWVEVLADSGYSISEHANGRDALEWWQDNRQRVSAIVMDLMMPVMNGAECLQKIRESGSEVPCLVTSGYTDRHRDLIEGLDHVTLLQKPFDLMAAAATLRELVDSSST